MKMTRGIIKTALLAVMIIAGVALSTTLDRVEVKCPLCGETFYATRVGSYNSAGGMDTDFLARPYGDYPQNYLVWTCPRDGFSAYGEEFEKLTEVDKALKGKLIVPEISEEERDGEQSQSAIPFNVKIENAAAYYESVGKGPGFMGELYLVGSWLARIADEEGGEWDRNFSLTKDLGDRFAENIQEVAPPEGIAKQYITLAAAMEKGTADLGAVYPFEIVAIAEFLRAGGEHARASRWLDRANDYGSLSTRVERLKYLISKEKEYQEKAAKYFVEDIESPGGEDDSKTRATKNYLAGEMFRRLGDYEKAKEYFARAEAEPEAPEWVAEAIKEAWSYTDIEPAGLAMAEVKPGTANEVETQTMEEIFEGIQPLENAGEGSPGSRLGAAQFYSCRAFMKNMQNSFEMHNLDYGVYPDNMDALAEYLVSDCMGVDAASCAGKVAEEGNRFCEESSLKIEAPEPNTYLIKGKSRDGCPLCVTPFGDFPEEYEECSGLTEFKCPE